MAHGTRGRWVRFGATSFGMMLCTGLVGCWNMDKDKDSMFGSKQGKAVQPGLPGTPMIQPGQGSPAASKAGQQNFQNYQYTGAGANLQPQGKGVGANQQRPGSNGMNNLKTEGIQPTNFDAQPGMGGAINAPAMQGVQPPAAPAGGFGATPPPSGMGAGMGSSFNPPPPQLMPNDMPSPPPPPDLTAPGALPSGFGPVPPPAPPASSGKPW